MFHISKKHLPKSLPPILADRLSKRDFSYSYD